MPWQPKDFEFIVIDSNSKDNTSKIIKENIRGETILILGVFTYLK